MATVGQAAAHIFLAERNFYELLDRGVVERMPAGEYDLEIVREEYIRHLQKVAAGREKRGGGKIDPEYERARKDRELADRTALQNAQTRGELVRVEDVGRIVDRDYANVRERILAMPGKLGTVLTPSQVALVEDECREALTDLHVADDFVDRLDSPNEEADEVEEDAEAAPAA